MTPLGVLLLSLAVEPALVGSPPAELESGGRLREVWPSKPDGKPLDSPQQRRRRDRNAGVYKSRVTPHWFAGDTRFWYRNDLSDDAREFILVDAERGSRGRAFDHEAVARQLGDDTDAMKLPVNELRFRENGESVLLVGSERSWRLDLSGGRLQEGVAVPSAEASDRLTAEARVRPSARTGPETQILFENGLDHEVEVFWIDAEGGRQSYGRVGPGSRKEQHTFGGHIWLVADAEGELLGVFEAGDDGGVAVIDGSKPQGRERRTPRDGRGRRSSDQAQSPDGRWTAFLKEQNVFVRAGEDGAVGIQLSEDGEEGNSYGRLEWSPDSQHLIAWRIERADRKEVFLVRSSPQEGGRAQLERRPYALPGDEFTQYELNVFDVSTRAQTKPDVDRFEHEWESPTPHWWPDTTRFVYAQEDRGHQRYRVIEVDVATGDTRNLIDERTETFIWTTHMEGPQRLGLRIVTPLDGSREIIHASESDGWRHLYLIDARTGRIRNQITQGEWVVRGIDRIDEEKRQIWFKASGMNPGQDPYLIHFYRINFDGTGLVALTEGDGNHSIEYSPEGRYFIDTYSRANLPPVTELRRVSDGKLVCPLEQADVSALEQNEWRAPEVFSAKGRDGKTDIWGIIVRPGDFDPSKQYPIIEDIYGGPQDSFVPKTFSAASRYQSLTEAGFIVVKIDGMGTANRSKAFHDVCWKNLKDGGFADRIAWMKAAAEKYPYMDASRVGVYGTSAGGQNAAAAVLFHPEFYKAAAANCGCHDNRLDKASWNEQWMGYLAADKLYEDSPDNWYARCSNIENAGKLQGHLLLCVGEMDSNVPVESTMRFVDALIRADRDFDLLVVPNGGHGAGGGYYRRRMQDFFLRHLQGVEPPNRNRASEEDSGRALPGRTRGSTEAD